MSDTQVKGEWLAVRHAEAKLIEPQTAELDWDWGQILDPYGIDPDLPGECRCVGRVYFARRPASDIWVCFYDLPKETREALWKRMRA